MRKFWTIGAATLLAATSVFVAGCKSPVVYERYDDASLYQVGEASYTAAQVRAVEIDWLGGSVDFEQNAAGQVYIAEDEGGANEQERMRYYLDGSTLKIRYCESGIRVRDQEKSLRVSLPAGLSVEVECITARVNVLDALEVSNFSLESVSGHLEAERILCAGETEVETVSGNVEIIELTAAEFSAETVSGDISVEKLSADRLEVDTTSGALTFGLKKGTTGELDGTSGHVKIKLLEGLGANITYESVSGELSTRKTNVKTGKTYAFAPEEGKETCNLRVETFSGRLTVE